jgi:hypothetical protein
VFLAIVGVLLVLISGQELATPTEWAPVLEDEFLLVDGRHVKLATH